MCVCVCVGHLNVWAIFTFCFGMANVLLTSGLLNPMCMFDDVVSGDLIPAWRYCA